MKSKSIASFIGGLMLLAVCQAAHATYLSTGWVRFDIRMDNGVTYLYPTMPNGVTFSPNCAYGRLELRETGDRFNAPENGKRMYALALTAKAQGLRVNFGYDDADGPSCRLAQLSVEWPQ
jgi:hypothetical protein